VSKSVEKTKDPFAVAPEVFSRDILSVTREDGLPVEWVVKLRCGHELRMMTWPMFSMWFCVECIKLDLKHG
jgi:hypothetical protein